MGFYVLDESGSPADTLSVTFGGFTTTLTGLDLSPGAYTFASFAIPGAKISASSTKLLFSADTSLSGQAFNIDDVSLVGAGATAVPEPRAWLLLATALLAVVASRGRTRSIIR